MQGFLWRERVSLQCTACVCSGFLWRCGLEAKNNAMFCFWEGAQLQSLCGDVFLECEGSIVIHCGEAHLKTLMLSADRQVCCQPGSHCSHEPCTVLLCLPSQYLFPLYILITSSSLTTKKKFQSTNSNKKNTYVCGLVFTLN